MGKVAVLWGWMINVDQMVGFERKEKEAFVTNFIEMWCSLGTM